MAPLATAPHAPDKPTTYPEVQNAATKPPSPICSRALCDRPKVEDGQEHEYRPGYKAGAFHSLWMCPSIAPAIIGALNPQQQHLDDQEAGEEHYHYYCREDWGDTGNQHDGNQDFQEWEATTNTADTPGRQ
jgi:hypothetical protein